MTQIVSLLPCGGVLPMLGIDIAPGAEKFET
jgi:hypothetical protein